MERKNEDYWLKRAKWAGFEQAEWRDGLGGREFFFGRSNQRAGISIERLTSGAMGVNWPGMGAVSLKTCDEFLPELETAIELVREFNREGRHK